MGNWNEDTREAALAYLGGTAPGSGGTNDTASFGKPAGSAQAGSIAVNGATALGAFDALNFQTISLQVSGTFVATLQFEVSNDGTNWVSKYLMASSGIVTAATAAGVFAGDLNARYFRVRASAYTSGTAVITAVFGAMSMNPLGSLSIGYVAPGNTGASLGKSEDAPHASGDVGVFTLGVRNDNAQTVLTSATGDYSGSSVDDRGAAFFRTAPASTPANAGPALAAATSTVLLAANPARRGSVIYNNSGADLFVKLGSAASGTSFTTIVPTKAAYEVPTSYAGLIHGFATLAVAANLVLVTEWTA